MNLFLAVGPKDARNYHPLRTVFQAIDLCDVVTVAEGSGKHQVLFDDPSIPAENTVTKSLRLLTEVLNLPPLIVTIEKRIPPESGLAGGSTDAAGVIRAAQRIAGVTIPAGELTGIAEAVGMDVPFFLVGGRAKAEGYGHRLTPLPDETEAWLVIARPKVGSSTPEAYRRLDESPYDWREFPEGDLLYNDFERVADGSSLELIDKMRRAGAKDATLCGSGSAVFGRFAGREQAEMGKAALLKSGASRVWMVRTLTRSESLRMQ